MFIYYIHTYIKYAVEYDSFEHLFCSLFFRVVVLIFSRIIEWVQLEETFKDHLKGLLKIISVIISELVGVDKQGVFTMANFKHRDQSKLSFSLESFSKGESVCLSLSLSVFSSLSFCLKKLGKRLALMNILSDTNSYFFQRIEYFHLKQREKGP